MKAYDIVGYTFAADIYCPGCILDVTGLTDMPGVYIGRITAERALDHLAERRGIDRKDESSFDSDDFPKVMFASITDEDDICGECHQPLIGD